MCMSAKSYWIPNPNVRDPVRSCAIAPDRHTGVCVVLAPRKLFEIDIRRGRLWEII